LSDNSKNGKKKKPKRKINWPEYNESLVRRGEMLFDDGFLQNWRAAELKKMNKGKEGANYRYPNSLILLLATVHAYLLPYRQLEGFLRVMSLHIKKLKEMVPDFTTIWWRVVRTKINLNPKVNLERDNIVIAVDSTGIKVTNRGEWILDKWKNKRKRKGFIKIHLAVNIKTKKIVSMIVTKEDVHDGKMLKEIVNDVSKNYDIKKVLADGGYDSKDNFRYLDELKITPIIKVRKNSSIKNNSKCIPRKLSVIQQLDNLKRWKKTHGYGMRWMAESAFSSIKRTFGEHVSSVKWNNIVNEVMLKASIYNLFMEKIMT
jgi:Transposase DDE domain